MTLKIKMANFSIFSKGFQKFFDSRMQNYIGKLKMMKWNRFDADCKHNESFSPAWWASQTFFSLSVSFLAPNVHMYILFCWRNLMKYKVPALRTNDSQVTTTLLEQQPVTRYLAAELGWKILLLKSGFLLYNTVLTCEFVNFFRIGPCSRLARTLITILDSWHHWNVLIIKISVQITLQPLPNYSLLF